MRINRKPKGYYFTFIVQSFCPQKFALLINYECPCCKVKLIESGNVNLIERVTYLTQI